jgi:hypothetical protein
MRIHIQQVSPAKEGRILFILYFFYIFQHILVYETQCSYKHNENKNMHSDRTYPNWGVGP